MQLYIVIKVAEGSRPFRTVARGTWYQGKSPVIYGELIPPDVMEAIVKINPKDQKSGTSVLQLETKTYHVNWQR